MARFEPDPFREELGRMLRDIRVKQGWSQKDMAKELGSTQATLSYLENGKVNVTIDTLARYAEFFGYEMEVRFNEPKTEWDAAFADALKEL